MENKVAALAAELREMAMRHDLCVPWQQMLSDATDKESMVRMYLRGIDFCLAYDYPGVEYMEKHFKGMCEPFGVFVSEPVKACNMRKVVAVGNSNGMAEYNGIEVARVFVKHTSRLLVIASGQAIVDVDCFDDSEVRILAKESARITVHRYGNARAEACGGDVKIIDKKCATYE